MRWVSTLTLALVFSYSASAASVDGLRFTLRRPAAAGRRSCWFTAGPATPRRGPRRCRCSRAATGSSPSSAGHGHSGAPKDGKFSMDLFARAVEAVRAEAGTDKIVRSATAWARRSSGSTPACSRNTSPPWSPWTARSTCASSRRLQAPAAHRPQGLKAREGMIRGMFTPKTPPTYRRVLAMMLKAPEPRPIGAMTRWWIRRCGRPTSGRCRRWPSGPAPISRCRWPRDARGAAELLVDPGGRHRPLRHDGEARGVQPARYIVRRHAVALANRRYIYWP